MKLNKIGEWSFLLGVLLAVLVGLFVGGPEALRAGGYGWAAILLVLLGILVGFLNISEKETTGYLVAAVALLLANAASGFESLPYIGQALAAMLANVALFVAPAAVIVALKAVMTLSKNR